MNLWMRALLFLKVFSDTTTPERTDALCHRNCCRGGDLGAGAVSGCDPDIAGHFGICAARLCPLREFQTAQRAARAHVRNPVPDQPESAVLGPVRAGWRFHEPVY